LFLVAGAFFSSGPANAYSISLIGDTNITQNKKQCTVKYTGLKSSDSPLPSGIDFDYCTYRGAGWVYQASQSNCVKPKEKIQTVDVNVRYDVDYTVKPSAFFLLDAGEVCMHMRAEMPGQYNTSGGTFTNDCGTPETYNPPTVPYPAYCMSAVEVVDQKLSCEIGCFGDSIRPAFRIGGKAPPLPRPLRKKEKGKSLHFADYAETVDVVSAPRVVAFAAVRS
jgi:hypothetical protein